jgi:hypothetical protein
MIHSARLALASDDPVAIEGAINQLGSASGTTRAHADSVYAKLEGLFAGYSAENLSVNVRNTADWAYVDPADTLHIAVTSTFLNEDVDLQAGILIHEGTHFYDVGGTLDLASGRMVQLIPTELRIYNADSYMNYAERAAVWCAAVWWPLCGAAVWCQCLPAVFLQSTAGGSRDHRLWRRCGVSDGQDGHAEGETSSLGRAGWRSRPRKSGIFRRGQTAGISCPLPPGRRRRQRDGVRSRSGRGVEW